MKEYVSYEELISVAREGVKRYDKLFMLGDTEAAHEYFLAIAGMVTLITLATFQEGDVYLEVLQKVKEDVWSKK
uniref:Phage protein n=1 Tax=Dulem virus 36 TaxID=3145754 RepID=A0AAU8B0U7_9CAUD